MVGWIYKGAEIEDNYNPKHYGFCYLIRYIDGTYYYGQKSFWSTTTKRAQKSGEVREGHNRIHRNVITVDGKVMVSKKDKAKARRDGHKAKRTAYDEITKQSKWRQYEGSTDNSKGKTIHSKHILGLAVSRQHLSYMETALLFQEEVLFDDKCLNANIASSYYDNILTPVGNYLKVIKDLK